jgi:hypothetical protein
MQALKLPIFNKSVLNGCSLWHPLNYNKNYGNVKSIENFQYSKLFFLKKKPNPTLSVVEKETG